MRNEKEAYDKTTVFEVYISEMHKLENIYKQYDELLTPLCVLLTNKTNAQEKIRILKEYGFSFEEKTEREVDTMCNLSETVYNKGKMDGRFIELSNLVEEGIITLEYAARKIEMTVEEFSNKMETQK